MQLPIPHDCVSHSLFIIWILQLRSYDMYAGKNGRELVASSNLHLGFRFSPRFCGAQGRFLKSDVHVAQLAGVASKRGEDREDRGFAA